MNKEKAGLKKKNKNKLKLNKKNQNYEKITLTAQAHVHLVILKNQNICKQYLIRFKTVKAYQILYFYHNLKTNNLKQNKQISKNKNS